MKKIIEKVLSSNDVGETGTHQAGILIPKRQELLSFFPELDINAENPRVTIPFCDDFQQSWKFNYIYYNNKFRGGTRNEYRLTGMTKFFRSEGLTSGDILVFENNDGNYTIHVKKEAEQKKENEDVDGIVTLTLDNTWRIISF